MTLEEAIKYNKQGKQFFEKGSCLESAKAIQLGIEALKRVKAYKEAHVGLHYTPMPGETEE